MTISILILVDMTDVDHTDQYGSYGSICPFHESRISTHHIYIPFYSTIDVSFDLFWETTSIYFYSYCYKNYCTVKKIILCCEPWV